MSTELPPQGEPPRVPSGRRSQVESEHVEVGEAHIDISSAEIIQSPASRRAARRLAWSLVVLFIVVIGISSAGLVFSVSQADVNSCQRIANAQFQRAEIDRATATRESAQAQIDLWNALLALRGTQAQKLAQFNRAFATYKAKLAQVTAIKFPVQTGSQSCSG